MCIEDTENNISPQIQEWWYLSVFSVHCHQDEEFKRHGPRAGRRVGCKCFYEKLVTFKDSFASVFLRVTRNL